MINSLVYILQKGGLAPSLPSWVPDYLRCAFRRAQAASLNDAGAAWSWFACECDRLTMDLDQARKAATYSTLRDARRIDQAANLAREASDFARAYYVAAGQMLP